MQNNSLTVGRYWIKVFFVLMLFSAILYFVFDSFNLLIDSPSSKLNKPDVAIQSTELQLATPHKNENGDSTTLTKDYHYCEDFLKAKEKEGSKWARTEHENWDEFLNDGFSLDEITLAIEHFAGSGFASGFRVQELRAESELVKINNQLERQARLAIPSLFESFSGISVEKKIPSPELADFNRLSADQRTTLLESVKPSVDDMAYFIADLKFSESDLRALLVALETPVGTVGAGRVDSVSLLDFAVAYSRAEIVKELLKRGLVPTSDGYLGSTMEWALSRLRYPSSPDMPNPSVQIVRMLIEHNAAASFEYKSDTQISGHFPRGHFSFNTEQVDYYLRNYGLDLTLIESREPVKVDVSSRLIKLLTQHKSRYLSELLGVENVEVHANACRTTLDVINRQWQTEQAHVIVKRVREENQDFPEKIELILSDIDPSLVDYYRAHYDGYKREQNKPEMQSGMAHYLKLINEGQIAAVIEHFSNLPLSDANKNWLFSWILNWDMRFYRELAYSDLMAEELQYFEFDSSRMITLDAVKKLREAGADLLDKDVRGKTFLYYAVKKGDTDLLHYLIEEQFPFSLDNTGEDPLHLALNKNRYVDSARNALNMFSIVEMLMDYQPEIDRYHMQRMAVLALQSPRLYRRLTSEFPQLKVMSDTVLPKVR